ncbi:MULTISPECIES: MFS transporter [Phyllobacteriaceae]|jgi:MFS transporter, DHA1 family, inner membrane transport protein|uniref:MFS transporter n=1 Tax=Mesorhizobium hungaricum TaxID=1566387 RepID=A0A1C2DCJ4_9HYPH|nr:MULTISPECIES: MFS transporter [Mesorhizobium]MBN9236890.1 MFS transporter [Mesorhizobium sp.]MDQ0331002.1 DHA1 family inner membrane transport protein [Mesorhizobium sp. YL-MeA3-2017]OCX12472.1 MFS transporter [Mesorhizobium hungaricum]
MSDAAILKGEPAVQPWLVMLALAIGGFAIGSTEFAAMSLLPYIAAGLGIDEPKAAHAISAYALGVVVGAPIIAVLSARVPRRTLLMALMAAYGITNCLTALAPNYEWLLVLRFLSGMPHGAYFGVAALVAASLVGPKERTTAIARVMLGLTVATIIGVPAATYLGQVFGWQAGFALTGFLALATFIMVALFAPRDRPDEDASPLRELGAFRNRQVLLTLATAIVGFGGLFAVYSYTASTLLAVTKVDPRLVPLVIGLFGVGMTLGNLVSAWAADKALKPTATVLLIASAAALFAFPYSVGALWSISLVVFLVGCTTGLAIVLQTYLMDVARDAQTLAAAANHSAFNVANALGPWLAGLAISAGYGFPSAGYVGCGLSLAGLVLWVITMMDAKRRPA